jgi:hypothetical protein
MRTDEPLQFRREPDSKVWHFHIQCSRWPKRSYVYADEPTDGAACKECMMRAGITIEMLTAK